MVETHKTAHLNLQFSSFIEEDKTKILEPSTIPVMKDDSLALPPPQPLLPGSMTSNDQVSTGLNMCFRTLVPFSQNPMNGAGPLNPSMKRDNTIPIDYPVFSNLGQQTLNQYVLQKFESIVYCRYGMEYLKEFQQCNGKEQPIGSYKINLDQLILNRSKQMSDEKSYFIGRSAIIQRKKDKQKAAIN